MKKKASVENILNELWGVNDPVRKGTARKDVPKIKETKMKSEKATPLELLEEEAKKKKKTGRKRNYRRGKIMVSKKKMKKQKRKVVGSWMTSKDRKRPAGPKVKIPTEIKGLDPLLSGGIESGSSFIIYGTPHCGKKPVIMRIAYSALRQKIPVIFILTDFGVKRWKEMMVESGWNLERFRDKVYFIDAYSQQYSILKNDENVTYLQVPFSLSTLSIECTKFIETCEFVWKKKPLIIFHSLSTLIENFGEAEVFNFLQFFLGKLGNENITSVYSLQAGMHSEKIETMIVSMIDGVLEMRDMNIRAKGFLDIKTQDWIPYKMTPKGIIVEFKEEQPEKRIKVKKKGKKDKKAKTKKKKAKPKRGKKVKKVKKSKKK